MLCHLIRIEEYTDQNLRILKDIIINIEALQVYEKLAF